MTRFRDGSYTTSSRYPALPDPALEHWFAAIEAMLFASDRPLDDEELAERLAAVEAIDASVEKVTAVIERVKAFHDERSGGFVLTRVAGGWEFRTRAGQADYVRALVKKKPVRLSRAALEVLAIVAYRQPCTRADVESIRGVDSSGVLRQLLERRLLKILGKSDDVGRPLLYGTSPHFLEFFGLGSLADLPTLKEYTELTEEHVVKLQEFEETIAANRAQGSLPTAERDEPPLPSGRQPDELLGMGVSANAPDAQESLDTESSDEPS